MMWWTLRKIRSKSPERRLEAVLAIQGSTNKEITDILIPILFDDDELVRKAAIRALHQAGWMPTGNELPISALEDPMRREFALQALAGLGWRAPDPQLRAVLAIIRGSYDEAIAEGPSA